MALPSCMKSVCTPRRKWPTRYGGKGGSAAYQDAICRAANIAFRKIYGIYNIEAQVLRQRDGGVQSTLEGAWSNV